MILKCRCQLYFDPNLKSKIVYPFRSTRKLKHKHLKLATKLIHAGIEPDPFTGAIMTPIYQTSTYVQESPGNHKGYEYARTQNPTRDALQNALTAIENGKHALCFASG